MSNASLPTLVQTSASVSENRALSNRWILNAQLDLLLFILSPLLVAPLVLLLQSPLIGVEVRTIALVVTAFGAVGHHCPGMIRAYCDRDLFRRFRMRLVLVPPLLFLVYFPLNQYHRTALTFVFTSWGCWHGLMQLYGFIRIYDAKVGSVSAVTANWDWLMCLFWFFTAEFFTNNTPSGHGLLENWYQSHGVTPPYYVQIFRWICLACSVGVLIGFLVNHLIQSYRGPRPNSAKLLMLASGIGFWWFAMVFVENPFLGVALFEIFHDIQYVVIVWLYNCRRVTSNPDIGGFMQFVFRRGMWLLYLGLVFAYGLIGFAPSITQSNSLKTIFNGILWTSTILHFYSDGFIWKVREKSTHVGLGLSSAEMPAENRKRVWGELNHLVKWSPLIALFGWLFVTDLTELRSQPSRVDRGDESIEFLETLVKQSPSSVSGHRLLGESYFARGEFDKAADCYRTVLALTPTKVARIKAKHRLGEIYRDQQQFQLAKEQFLEVLREDPQYEASIKALDLIEKSGLP